MGLPATTHDRRGRACSPKAAIQCSTMVLLFRQKHYRGLGSIDHCIAVVTFVENRHVHGLGSINHSTTVMLADNKPPFAIWDPPDYFRPAEALAAARGGPPEPSFEEKGHAVLQGFYATAAAGANSRTFWFFFLSFSLFLAIFWIKPWSRVPYTFCGAGGFSISTARRFFFFLLFFLTRIFFCNYY